MTKAVRVLDFEEPLSKQQASHIGPCIFAVLTKIKSVQRHHIHRHFDGVSSQTTLRSAVCGMTGSNSVWCCWYKQCVVLLVHTVRGVTGTNSVWCCWYKPLVETPTTLQI